MPRCLLVVLGLLLVSCTDGERFGISRVPSPCVTKADCGNDTWCSPRGWCIPTQGCVADADCGEAQTCSITGACLATRACLLDSDCPQVPDPMACLEGRCDYAPACHGDADCQKGSFCDDHSRCRGLISQAGCSTDQDCRVPCQGDHDCVGEGAVCHLPAGFCSNSAAFYCGADGTCLFGAACTASSQCPAGQSCSPAGYCGADFCFDKPCAVGFRCASDGACYLEFWACTTDDACPPGQRCNSDARCRPATCSNDSDCGPGAVCGPSGCEVGVCGGDGDCLDGMRCQEGACAWLPCDGGRNCPKPLTCGVDNFCRQAVACLEAADCSLNESCLDGRCVELRPCQAASDCPLASHCGKDGFCIKGN